MVTLDYNSTHVTCNCDQCRAHRNGYYACSGNTYIYISREPDSVQEEPIKPKVKQDWKRDKYFRKSSKR